MVIKTQIGGPVPPSVSRIRSVSSQLIACMSQNLLLLDLGMAISFSTIALPDLLNAKEGLSLTENQASWFGSLSYLTQPFGGVISGPIVDYLGRKKATFLVNIPHFVAWILMHYAWNVPSLFIANGLLGFGTGLMEAPINSYVGEITGSSNTRFPFVHKPHFVAWILMHYAWNVPSLFIANGLLGFGTGLMEAPIDSCVGDITEPSIRGALCTVTQFFTSIGVMLMYLLGNVVTWRQAALICLIAPIASMLFVLLIPETPVWLLSKNREKEALKSLCYLRGWTTPDNVRDEFSDLVVYTKKLQRCAICCKTDEDETRDCEHYKMNFIRRGLLKFRYVMMTKETLRPFTLVIMYFLFHSMSGLTPIRPNMVNVCGAFGMPDDGKHIVLMIGIITFITSFLVIGLIKVLGKRKLATTAMFGTGLCCMALSIYAKQSLDPSVFSYDISTFPTEVSYVPLVFFYGLTVFTGLGIPWVLLGEVFPFRSRAAAQGLAAAGNYIITFLGSKTFINFETSVQLWGAFAIYASFAYVGTIYLYFFLPETEGVTLQEIESYYSGKFRIFADDPIINLFKRLKR